MKRKFLIALSAFALVACGSLASFAQGKCNETGSIRRVTKARSSNFETVTFEMNGNSADYKVENAKPPFETEGEQVIKVKGKFFKSVNFKSVFWTCKIRENTSAATTTIMDVKNIEQFEGYVGYAIGYRKRSKYVGTTESIVGKNKRIVVKFRR